MKKKQKSTFFIKKGIKKAQKNGASYPFLS